MKKDSNSGLYSLRRKIVWKKLNGVGPIAAFLVATALGAGLFPVAPGTMGTLMGIPIAYFSQNWDWPFRVLLWSVILAIGTLAASSMDRMMGT